MKQPRAKTQKLILLFLLSFLLTSCEQEYFDLSIYSSTSGLTPTVFLPVTLGDYVVKDYTKITEAGNTPIVAPLIKLDSIKYDLTGFNLGTAAVDTLFMIIKTSNATPMQLQYTLLFEAMDAGSRKVEIHSQILQGGVLDAAGHVTKATENSSTFSLSNSEYKIFCEAKRYTLLISLMQPQTGTVYANDLKTGKISVKVAYRASVNILKL